MEDLNDTNFGSDGHVMFLSHFKQEAGTEAAMLEEALHHAIERDEFHPGNLMKRPVFLDSNDLFDLSRLRQEVIESHNLVVLLTPGVLTRPWCLVEIVTAVRHNINLVPVRIVRDGINFCYPDDAFYDNILKG